MPYAYFGVVVSQEKLTIDEEKAFLIFKDHNGEDVLFSIQEIGPGNLESIAGRIVAMVRHIISEARSSFHR